MALSFAGLDSTSCAQNARLVFYRKALEEAPRENRGGRRLAKRARPPASGLLLFKLQVKDDFFLTVEAGDGAGGRLGAIFLRVNLVIHIGIQAAEAVVAFVVGDIAANSVSPGVFEEDHAGRDGRFGRLVNHNSAHGAKLRFALGILRQGGGSARCLGPRHCGRQWSWPGRRDPWHALPSHIGSLGAHGLRTRRASWYGLPSGTSSRRSGECEAAHLGRK